MCLSNSTCAAGDETLYVGQMVRTAFTLNASAYETVQAWGYWNGVQYTSFEWSPSPAGTRYYATDPGLGFPSSPGTIEVRVFVGTQFVGTYSRQVVANSPTATPTPTPTPTPTTYGGGGGGGGGCVASQATFDWHLCVTYPTFPGNLFDIVVTPLTAEAADSFSFKVRVYKPGDFVGADSFSEYFFNVGQGIRIHYPDYDFLLFDDELPDGYYEVELRVDFLHEVSVFVYVG